ncbi:helix-hairpin-helix domain-containing protein [Shinella yambaruensis]|uniref:DNA polymerase III n=1 Tax=Shinella yambaruensis TaxID=415996 RepID=A0ABQ5ZS42_9HYPH|nr:helix-hairpin-helix domain-containing protein [Shinella yambaruensis]MCJ8025198.1 helix-hairpin-helix domain-containing protein [Shinella yambaruensis]MCU7981168.1 helix-hairpin-helix domain-containing protein [Shinella yambaruensis]GLR53688.1 DNA polymerase III [Shinella yambaruensis]
MTTASRDFRSKSAEKPRHQLSTPDMAGINRTVAGKLREYADLLVQQGEGGFRSRAFQKAGNAVEALPRGVDEILAAEGRAGLVALPTIGYGIAAAIAEMLATGRWSQLDRLQGEFAPETLFQTIPGIGPRLARRLAEDGHLENLADLEYALHLNDLSIKGIGKRRKRMIADALSERLGQPSQILIARKSVPSVTLLLDVDRTYRERAAADKLRKIAPRRFNPNGEAWLPIMHMRRAGWHFTVHFSNSRLAHELRKTRDWVIVHFQRDGETEGRCTAITETSGPMMRKRVIRGR